MDLHFCAARWELTLRTKPYYLHLRMQNRDFLECEKWNIAFARFRVSSKRWNAKMNPGVRGLQIFDYISGNQYRRCFYMGSCENLIFGRSKKWRKSNQFTKMIICWPWWGRNHVSYVFQAFCMGIQKISYNNLKTYKGIIIFTQVNESVFWPFAIWAYVLNIVFMEKCYSCLL